jgi:hypothetical protein
MEMRHQSHLQNKDAGITIHNGEDYIAKVHEGVSRKSRKKLQLQGKHRYAISLQFGQ